MKLDDKIIDKRVKKLKIKRLNTSNGNKIPIEWSCLTCGHIWKATPKAIFSGKSCPQCFKQKHNKHFEKKIDYFLKDKNINRISNFSGARKQMLFECSSCNHVWSTKPNNVIRNCFCPGCSQNRSYSKTAITWLETIMKGEKINIRHAENGGEFIIPNTRYKADGFCKETNTIYEFYGDAFHGNLNIYNENDLCHPFIKNLTAKDLFEKTKEREQIIKAKGYKLITIWENDFLKSI